MNLTEWARVQGVHPQTAYRWFREGTLPVPAVRVNSRSVLVAPDSAAASASGGGLGLYARVSSHGQEPDLDRQVARLAAWAAASGQPVARVEAEVGSGMNGARSKARRLLADLRVRTVVVEHRDRLGRVNTELVEAALSAHGRRLVVLDPTEVEGDLVRDMTEILTSFCARLYGRGSARSRAEKALRAAARDGRVRAAVTRLIATAKAASARAIIIENLDFAEARAEGRERTGNRPSRGRRGRSFRRLIAGIPAARFRDRLTQMTANAGLSVVVVGAAYSSRWGAQHWLAPLREHHPETTGHHAAALVLGRRGLGHRARRRANGNRTAPADAVRPAPARPRKPSVAKTATRKPAGPRDQRQPPGAKTGTPHRTTAGNQAPEDRSRAPAGQYSLLRSD